MKYSTYLFALTVAILPGRSSAIFVAAYQYQVDDMGVANCTNITDGSGATLQTEAGLYLVGSRTVAGIQVPSYRDGAGWHDLAGGPQGGLLNAGSVDGNYFAGYTLNGAAPFQYHAAMWRRSDGQRFDVENPTCTAVVTHNCWKTSRFLTISNDGGTLRAGGWGTWANNNGAYPGYTAVYATITNGVVGYLQDPGNRIIDTLNGLPSGGSQITSINDQGLAVGSYLDQTGTTIGFFLDLANNGNSVDWGRAAGWTQENLTKVTGSFFIAGSAFNTNLNQSRAVLFLPNPWDVTPNGSTNGEVTSMSLRDYVPSAWMPPSIGWTNATALMIWNPWNESGDLSSAPFADFSGWDQGGSVRGIRKDGAMVGARNKAGVGHCFKMTPTTYPVGFQLQPWGQGWTSQQQVLLSAPVPGQGSSLTIRLQTNNDLLASVPSTVVVSSGQQSATFTVTRHVAGPGGVAVNAYLGGVATTSAVINWP